jgi:type I restriction enzyme S subunit
VTRSLGSSNLFDYAQLSPLRPQSVRLQEVEAAGGTVLSCQRYSEEGYKARKLLAASQLPMETTGLQYSVWMPTRFARVRVEDAAHGVPFLTGSSIMMARREAPDFISRKRTEHLEEVLLRQGSVLVTRSGTVGNVAFCSGDLVGCAGTDDIIRVDAKPGGPATEYAYVVFLSPLGQSLLTQDTYGGVVDHIEPAHIAAQRIPMLPKACRGEIVGLIRETMRLRDSANELLDEALTEVQKSCFLSDLASIRPRNCIESDGHPEAFSVTASERLTPESGFGELRLDGSYHLPLVVALRKHILAHESGQELSEVIGSVRNSGLRKRVYVDDPALGTQMLGGKQLMQTRPQEVKLLSKVLTRNLASEVVQNGWTLVSSGGTLGRTLFVHRNLEGTTVSQDVMRILPNPEKALPGFIYAFLASPYGQVQIRQRGYGSVIPRLRDFQFNSIAIRVPKDKGEAIHQKVVQAFDARADAKTKEDSALKLFMSALANGRAYVESEWGKEY